MVYKSGVKDGNVKVPLIVNAEFKPVVAPPKTALQVQSAKFCPPVVNEIPLAVPVTVPLVVIFEVVEPVIVPPLEGVTILPEKVTKLPPAVGSLNAPAVNVVVPVIINVLFEMVVPVAAVGLLIVNAAIVAGNKAPVTCDAVALLKVKLVVGGKAVIVLVVTVPFIPPVLAVANEPLGDWV